MPASRFKLLAVAFAGLLLLPAADSLLGLSARFRSTEKRRLLERPAFQFSHVRAFARQFDAYFSENFGGRNLLFYQYSRCKYNLLGVSPLPDKVVVGQRGWFYPGNNLGQVADQHRGLRPITPHTLHQIADRLLSLQQYLAKQQARLYVLIAPDSYTIYPEHLPEAFQSARGPSNFDRLKQYLAQHTRVPLVDVRPSLRAAKCDYVVYYQTDTHWNDYGSLVASLTLVNRLRQDFPGLAKGSLSDYAVRARPGDGGDLVGMLALHCALRDSVAYEVRPRPGVAARQTESVPDKEMNLPRCRFVGGSRQGPKLLLIGDSFSYSLNQFVPNYFGESYLVRSQTVDPQLIKTERPDIVVIEVAERNMNRLADL